MAADTHLATTLVATALKQLLQDKRRIIDSECERFVGIGDAESLHDLRVAIRRLHSLFVGFAHCFRHDSALPDALHALFRETNHARDLEVTLALLQGQQLALPWLQQQWQSELEAEYRRLRECLPPSWRALSQQFEAPEALLAETQPATTLGRYAAAQAAGQQKTLLKRVKRVCRKWNDKRAHKLRIHGKCIRYLLEPLADEQPNAAMAVARLKQFQDQFGDYHDLVVLRKRLRRLQRNAPLNHFSALRQARLQLKQEQRQQRRSIRRGYLGKALRQLHDALVAAQEELARE